jgi:transketolase
LKLQYSADALNAMAHTLRVHVIQSIHAAGSGHPGGSLSLAEIMSVLFFHVMNVDPENPAYENRDRFVLSKGHAAPVYYAALSERVSLKERAPPAEKKSTAFCRDTRPQAHTRC